MDIQALLKRSHTHLVESYTKHIIQRQEEYKDKEYPPEIIAELAPAMDYLGKHNIPIPGRQI